MPRALYLALWVATLVACAGMLQAQSIIVGQPQLNFAAAPGGNSTVQTLPIQGTGTSSIPYIISFAPASGGNWLYFSPSFGNLPANVLLMAASGTLGPGTYTGVLTITAPAANNSPVNIPVTFSVGQSTIGVASVSPSALTFTGQVNGPSPLGQLVTVNPYASPFTFSASASTNNGVGWLQITPTFGAAPSILNVNVQTQGLSAGYYYGSITIIPSLGPVVTVPVTLILTTTNTVTFSTSTLQFYYQIGSTTPAGQTFIVNTDPSAPIPFSIAASTATGDWLSVTPVVSTAPQTVTVAVNPSGLAPGIYTGNLAVAAGAVPTALQNIAVTLTVSTGTLLTVGTPPAPFNYTTGGPLPAGQGVLVDTTSGLLSYSVTAATTSGNWLVVGPSTGTTPQTLTVGVNPTGLAPGTYSGLVTLTSPTAVNSPQAFPVTLNVNTVQSLTAAPAALNFNYQIGTSAPPTAQSLQVTTAVPAQVNVSVSTTSCGNWLQTQSSSITAPGNVVVLVNSNFLNTPQVCAGFVTLTLAGVTTVQVPVALNVSNTALLNITPPSLDFVVDYNSNFTATQNINLTTTDNSPLQYLAATGINSGWLSVAPAIGKAPATLTVGIYTGGLAPGKYTGNVTITAYGLASPQPIPVNLTVKPATTAVAQPSVLSFTQSLGGNAPASQQLSITTANGNFPYNVTPSTSGGLGWLRVSPISGTTPGIINVSASSGVLPIGTYHGSVVVSMPGASNDPLVVPVTLTITSGIAINASPASLNFAYQLGSLFNPGDQLVTVGATGGGVLNYTTSATTFGGSGNWLTVKPSSASTPSTAAVTVSPSGLAVGTYTGQVSIVAPGVVGSPILIPVTLTVQPQPTPILSSIMSAATGISGAVSVGEIVTLKGTAMGPVTPLTLTLDSSGKVDTVLAFTRVLFDGYAAPMLYTSRGQINTVVPYEVSGRPTVQVQVENQGLRSQALTVSTIAVAPGIFTANSTGTGQGAVLNQDSTPNTVDNPAAPGSIVQIFATGEGQTDPVGITGSVAGSVLPKPVGEVTATVNGQPAEVRYAGAAPGAVAGLLQVNVKLPDGITGDTVKIAIAVSGVASQPNVTIAVR